MIVNINDDCVNNNVNKDNNASNNDNGSLCLLI